MRVGNEKEQEQNKPSRAVLRNETSDLKRHTLGFKCSGEAVDPIGPDLTALEYTPRLAPLLKTTVAETGREGRLRHLARI